jgi:hypothetical protein
MRKAYLTLIQIFTLVLLLWSCETFCQKKPIIKNDKKYKFAYRDFVDSLKIPQPNFKEVELELRFWTLNWSDGNHTLILLKKLKSQDWQGMIRRFNFYNDDHYNFAGQSNESKFRLGKEMERYY